MIKKRYVLSTIVLSSIVAAKVYSIDTPVIINDIKIGDISDAPIESNREYKSEFLSLNSNDIKRYDYLTIESKNIDVDLDNSEYILEITFKNSSKHLLKDLSIDLELNTPFEVVSETIYLKELKRNDSFSVSLRASLFDVINTYLKNEKPTSRNVKKTLDKLYEDEPDFLEYTYKYKDRNDDVVEIKHKLNNKFKKIKSTLNVLNEFNEVEKENHSNYYKNNGMYLNLNKINNTFSYSDVETVNLNLDIDDDYNFIVTGRFKNIGNKRITNFEFKPALYMNNMEIPVYLTFGTSIQRLKEVKPNQEFELKLEVPINKLFNTIYFDTTNSFNGFNKKKIYEIISEAVNNRLITLTSKIEYSNPTNRIYELNAFDNKGVLSHQSINKYNLNN